MMFLSKVRLFCLLPLFFLNTLIVKASVWQVDSISNAGYGSFRAAVDSALIGDTIRFNPNLIANGSDSIVLNSALEFSKSVKINGLYNTTDTLFISGGGSVRIFEISNCTKVELDSLVLVNGWAYQYHTFPLWNTSGGAILALAVDSLIIRNSVFRDNSTARCGGAVSLENAGINSALVVTNSLFTNNWAGSEGGGIFFSSDSIFVQLNKVKLIHNNAPGGGGAMKIDGVNTVDVNINKSVISHNNCTSSIGWGGGLRVYGYRTIVNISSTIIDHNSSARRGGGVHVFGQDIAKTYISYCTFNNNTSIDGGGGLFCTGWLTVRLEIIGSTFYQNHVYGNYGYGGAVHCESNNGTGNVIKLRNSSFVANSAQRMGGVNFHSSSIIFYNVSNIFSNNLGGNVPTALLAIQSGYNIYSDISRTDTVSTDQVNVNANSLNLGPLINNGRGIPTLMPGPGSVAINRGNPLDSTDAQNAYVLGIREVGATEVCYNSISIDTVVSCGPYSWLNGQTYLLSSFGDEFVMPNSAGCDSVITLNLTLLNSPVTVIPITACDSLSWNGVMYTSSTNVPTYTLTNNVGCDSVINLHLTIFNTSYRSDVITACDSLTWINGITYFSSVNSISDTLQNNNGCDSIITLDLTITSPTSFTDVITACDTFTWINGITYYSSNPNAVHTLLNSVGCDSIITLDLILSTIDSSVVQTSDTLRAQESGLSYQWIDCNSNMIVAGATLQEFVPIITGVYKVAMSNGICADTSGCYQVNICANQAVYSYTNNGAGNMGFTDLSLGTYTQLHWSFGDGTTSTLANPDHVYQTNGNFVVVLTINDSIAHTSCVSFFLDTLSITGVGSPLACQAGFSVYYDSVNSSVNVINSSIGSNLTYSWNFGDGSSSNLQFPTHSYTTNGPFNLCVTIDDDNGCIDTFCDSISNQGVWFRASGFDLNVKGAEPNSMTNVDLSQNLNIYPNPVHDEVHIELTNWPTNGVKIVIRDVSGKQVFTREVAPVSDQETISINTSKWAKGTYFIKVGDGVNVGIEKMVMH